jgi:D-serine deaminase-like pyridoxal phosphate-dependent protein
VVPDIVPPVRLDELVTPALLVDEDVLEANLAAMAAFFADRPAGLRPHFKAHKCVEIARRQREHGIVGMTAQIPYEAVVLAEAGFDDILIANQVVGRARVAQVAAAADHARITVAVDSPATVSALQGLDVGVLIEVNVGLPRGGIAPEHAGELAAAARSTGLAVRGVQGYEGHAVLLEDRAARQAAAERAMATLLGTAPAVGGDVVSAGGTGTYDITGAIAGVTEIQAGSYALMDTAYSALGLPFREALSCLATVTSVAANRYVLDAGLKALATDHGPPSLGADAPGEVWFLSDEHTTVRLGPDERPPRVGDLVRVRPSHVDPTVALYDRLWFTRHDEVLESHPVARGWGQPGGSGGHGAGGAGPPNETNERTSFGASSSFRESQS